VFLTDTLYFICIDKHIGMTNVKIKLKLPVLSELGSNLLQAFYIGLRLFLDALRLNTVTQTKSKSQRILPPKQMIMYHRK